VVRFDFQPVSDGVLRDFGLDDLARTTTSAYLRAKSVNCRQIALTWKFTSCNCKSGNLGGRVGQVKFPFVSTEEQGGALTRPFCANLFTLSASERSGWVILWRWRLAADVQSKWSPTLYPSPRA
jgi:hypothetical protein